ncbi:MAG: IS110 family transposase [Nitrospinota bacterium]
MSQFYPGIDLAARSLWICILDKAGSKKFNGKVLSDPHAILAILEPFLPHLSAVVESTFNWYWIVDLLQDHGIDVQLAHPLYLKAIAYAKVKTDQVDAHTLAQLQCLDYIPQAFIYPKELRPTRDLIRRRHHLVNLRSGLYRDLQLQLLRQNISHFDRKSIKTLDGRNLRALLPQLHERRAGLAYLHLIQTLDQQTTTLDKDIQTAVHRKKPILLLRSIPGIGKTFAPTIYYEVGQIHHFPSDKAFASYCRLAPTISQSGTITRRGKNRKQGNPSLKWAFSEAAQMAIQRYPAIRFSFLQTLKKKKKRMLAKAILAHKLAVIAFHVLNTEVPYRPNSS